MHDDLKLLVEWSSPWEEFVSAIRPAFAKSAEPLEAEAHTGLFPYRGGLVALAGEVVLLIALIFLPSKFASMHPFQPAPSPKYDVIYFSGNELPRMEDAGGARSGRSGRSGGREGHHASQVIRVARGPSLKERVVDAPKLNLPNSNSAVANLLAYKSMPGPPPTQGMESSSRHAEMAAAAVPPPAAMQAQTLQSAPSMQASIVAPTPSALQHELNSRHISRSRMDAVPPPVSAPQAVTILNPKLRLPQALVVPPAPSKVGRESARARSSDNFGNQTIVPPAPEATNSATGRQMASVGNASVVAPSSQISNASAALRQPAGLGNSSVVAPTSQIANAATASRHTGSLGNSAVVAPPSQISGASPAQRQAGGLGNSAVVAPPSQINGATASRQPGSLGNSAAVAPPSQINGASSAHRQPANLGESAAVAPTSQLKNVSSTIRQNGGLGDSRIVPPTAQASGSLMRHANGLSEGTSVVQPAPSVSSGSNLNSKGQGRSGQPDMMASAAVAPPTSSSGIVLSARPGAKIGSPAESSAGSMAMSPSGGAKPGLGGTGGGSGISNGNGSGSSTSGSGPGAKTSGSGPGSSETAHNGISPFPGTGGAGKGTNGAPALSGVSVSGGGNNTVRLPSFGTDNPPLADSAHSPDLNASAGPGITVVATSHSGGAFNFYGALKGDKVYTIYIDTALGTAVMQFADPKSATEAYPEDLTAPQALRAELPSDVTASRLVIACVLDRTGLLKTPRVVEASSPELSAKVMAELPKWKFRPVFRGNQAIEVNAILGFDIDTR